MTMGNLAGDFIWYELIVPDVEAAKAFYGPVLGWEFREMSGGMPYTLAIAPPQEVAGIYAAGEGMPTAWIGYIGVEDVDATVAAIVAEGGREMVAARDIPGVGRLAGVADPQGVGFMVMRGASEGESPAFDTSAAGHVNWNEVATPDPEAGLAFYIRHFGWEKGDAMPMGEMGDYQFITHGGRTIGAIMRLPPGPRPPSFLFYFGVPGIDAATAAVKAGGGTVVSGPNPIPGDMFATWALDPQGAAFGLVGPAG